MSALPIPFSEILAFLSFYPWHDNEKFIHHIMALDNHWLSESAKKDSAKRESGKTTSKPKNPR